MKLDWRVYALLAGIFVASVGSTLFLQLGALGQTLAPLPAVISLIGILYQLLRDEARHQREITLQRDQQFFDLGITSHMADVAFDKHVAFCEEYVAELHSTIWTLMREAETKNAIVHADNLVKIRRKYSVWLTKEIEDQLEPIDLALRKMGSTAWLREQSPSAALQSGRMEEMYHLFADIVGLAIDPERKADKEIAVTNVIARIREMLGAPQLVALRQRLLDLNQAR